MFTTQFEVKFKYIESKMDQHFMRFFGDDDVWGYVSSFGDTVDPNYASAKLVMDIGGVHPAAEGKVFLGAAKGSVPGLNLKDGHRYALTLFHAERQCCQS